MVVVGIIVGLFLVTCYGIFYIIRGICRFIKNAPGWDVTILEPAKLRVALWDEQEGWGGPKFIPTKDGKK